MYVRAAVLVKVPPAARSFWRQALFSRSLSVSPAQACACGEADWSMMSDKEIVSIVNGLEDETRIIAGKRGELPRAPAGYRYDASFKLVPVSG